MKFSSTRIPVVYLGLEYRSVHDGDRRGFTVETFRQVRGRMLWDTVQLQSAKGSDDVFDGREELESTR